MISVRPADCLMWQKLTRCDFLGHYKHDKCRTLHDGSTVELYPFIPLSVTSIVFQGLSSVKHFFFWNFMFLSDLVETSYSCWLHQVDHEYATIFDLPSCSREIIDIFPHLKKKFNVGFFLDTIKARSFKLCMIDFNLAWDLHCHSRFNDLDLVSRTQLCQKY